MNLAEDVILHLSVLFVPGVWAISRTIIFSFLESLLEFFVHLGPDVEALLALQILLVLLDRIVESQATLSLASIHKALRKLCRTEE